MSEPLEVTANPEQTLPLETDNRQSSGFSALEQRRNDLIAMMQRGMNRFVAEQRLGALTRSDTRALADTSDVLNSRIGTFVVPFLKRSADRVA